MRIRDAVNDVRAWNETFGHLNPNSDEQDERWSTDGEHVLLALNLVQEEVEELHDAAWDDDKVEILDAVCDILVTVFGLAAKAGVDQYVEDGFREVMESNWSKADEYGHPVYVESGKIGKSDQYRPPNLESILNEEIAF